MRTEIVGRDPELDAVRGFFGGSRESPSALLLEGEAGIGKTTILEEGVRLGATERTVEAHVKQIFQKLGLEAGPESHRPCPPCSRISEPAPIPLRARTHSGA